MLRGGDKGPVVVVGKPNESLLVQRAAEGSMPPITDGDALPPEEVETLRKWIDSGAEWSLPAVEAADDAKSSPTTLANCASPRHRYHRLLKRILSRRRFSDR
jgi:hypothetical protein